MTVQNIFEPNASYRFVKENISVLLHTCARFKHDAILTNIDVLRLFKAQNRFLEAIGTYDRESQGFSTLMTAEKFPNLDEVEFYKFLPPASLGYYRSGSFQFGSVQFYRDIESQNGKDRMEGFANIVFQSPKHMWAMSLASGYNFGVFCGTSSLTMRDEMSRRFGPHIIRIKNLRAFAEKVQALLGGRRFYFKHVSYNDLKMFRTRTLKTLKLSQDDPAGDFDADLVTDAVFGLLYRDSFLPSLFMKPTRFRHARRCTRAARSELTNPAYRFKRIGLEAGPLSQWLYSALAEAGLPVICVETRHMRAVLKAQINKTDRNDARGMAQMMRVGLYRPVHVKTLRSQKLRMLLTHRKLLQSKAIAIENDLRGTLRNFGLKATCQRIPIPTSSPVTPECNRSAMQADLRSSRSP